MMAHLNDLQEQSSHDDFPLYLFYADVLDEDPGIAVYGLPSKGDPKTYEHILIRSKDASIGNKDQDA